MRLDKKKLLSTSALFLERQHFLFAGSQELSQDVFFALYLPWTIPNNPRIAQRVVSQEINELEPCGWIEEIVETAGASDQGMVIKLDRSSSFAPASVGYPGHAPDRGDHAGRCPALCRPSTNQAPGAGIRAVLRRR